MTDRIAQALEKAREDAKWGSITPMQNAAAIAVMAAAYDLIPPVPKDMKRHTLAYRRRLAERLNEWADAVLGPKDSGFALLEVMFAVAMLGIVAMISVTIMANNEKELKHYALRSEMKDLMESADDVGDPCKSVSVGGGVPPLGACGSPNTPQTIPVLYSDGTPVHMNSAYLLQAVCNPGFYTLQIKASLATKVDPFNRQAIGAAFFAPVVRRFAEKAWLVGGCP